MGIVVGPQQTRTTGLQEFVNSANPMLQQAFAAYQQKQMYAYQLQKQQEMANQQRQQNMEQTQQIFPGVFSPIPEQYKNYAKIQGEQGVAGQGIVPIKPPEGYKPQYQFNPIEAEKYPSFGFDSKGEWTWKSQTPMFGSIGGDKPSTVPKTAKEAKDQFLIANPQYNESDLSAVPKPLPGGKGVAYWEASVTPSAEDKYKESGKNLRGVEKGIGETEKFIRQFELSYDELKKSHPDIGATGPGGFATRVVAGVQEKVGSFPQTSTFMRELQPKANAMARSIEGGRVTDQDRKIYADSFAGALSAPSETNIGLMANALVDAQNKGGNITPILDVLKTSKNEVMKGVLDRVNQDIMRQQAIEELRRRGIMK